MKKVLIEILSSFYRLFTRNAPPAVIESNVRNVADKMEKYDDAFFSYHLRPANSMQVSKDVVIAAQTKVAIVIQGPLLLDHNFTLETVRIYKKIFPGAELIISTWMDQDKETLDLIKAEGAHLVLTKLPDNRGPLNINLQIISARNGVLKAKDIDVNYVFKTRSDQRMYANNIVPAMLGLLDAFPVDNETSLNKRIIVSNFTTLKNRPYGVGDMLMFGTIDDMQQYWDANLDDRVIDKAALQGMSALDYAKERLAETYLCTDFLLRMNYPLQWTLKDSWSVYRTMFCVVDHEMFDMYWCKYDREIARRFDYYHPHGYQIMKFNDWLSLYSNNLDDLGIDESKLLGKEGKDF